MAAPSHPASKHITDVDILVGKKIRARRLEVGLTQQRLASLLGITFTQVQKYEQGMNRVAASRLVDSAQALDVSPAFFFDPIPAPLNGGQFKLERDLIRDLRSLPSDELRQAAAEIVRQLARTPHRRA